MTYIRVNYIDKGLSGESYNMAVKSIRFFYSICFDKELKKSLIPNYKLRKRLPNIIDKENFINIFNNEKHINHKCWLLLAFCSGLRVEEVATLKIENIYANEHKLKVLGKGNKERYTILPDITIKFLRLYCKEKKITRKSGLVTEKKWLPMGKSIANLYRYAEVCKAINMRYINALPIPAEKEKAIKKLEAVSNRKEVNNRIYTGFNLFNKDDIKLFNILADASLIINGFDNKILRSRYFKDEEDFNSQKIRNKTTRLIDKLRKHGIIKKVGSASKYYITESGREMLNYFILYQNKEIPEYLKSN